MSSIEEDAAQWGLLIQAQHDYVAGLLQEKATLRAALDEDVAPASIPPGPASTTSDSDAAVAQAQLHSLQEYTMHLEEELKSTKEKHTQELEKTRRESLHPQATQSNLGIIKPAPCGRSHKTSSDSPAFILVLIDGSSAPFSDGLIPQGRSGGEQAAAQVREVENDLRTFDVEFDLEEGSSGTIKVLCFVYYSKAALVSSLLKAQVISSGATWEAFALAFNSSSLCYIVDIGNAPVESKCTSLISLLGPLGRLKRFYLVGLHPAFITHRLPDLGNEGTVLGRRMAGKMVAVNHRESESDRAELARFGWRVAVFSRFFSANSGLGGDWGWPVGGNNDGANGDYGGYDSYSTSEYGSPGMDNNAVISGKGSWSEPSKHGNWKSVSGSGKNKKALLKIDTNRASLNQDPQICVFHYLTRLKQDVGKSPCKKLRKNGTCRWQAENGTKCMYSHDHNGKRSY